ncbi:hypothetical protein TbgDal_VI2310 [Trypanosoma brucei gambiense DAL972]|uniref:Uncharacterized protein n=1 Tax=Trypanosoma brucei gambiense (strain MHOM/CI/86/DAL972) TaxID=679716 RepID=C9ZQS3_TRYB9|nr:hypothetical protein TbgDal_VI2310 [Trypanosoma brucei gambiense DAL972]CBH11753.1 hypothetical protein TbgDal_VI2310 [Trypanosoma brucei gambiense DAL972]|eukprot:XP_011774038.1 hypothetical protein TbgDal_VI2310 [Trypanosoma brucei gambiense DAL972]
MSHTVENDNNYHSSSTNDLPDRDGDSTALTRRKVDSSSTYERSLSRDLGNVKWKSTTCNKGVLGKRRHGYSSFYTQSVYYCNGFRSKLISKKDVDTHNMRTERVHNPKVLCVCRQTRTTGCRNDNPLVYCKFATGKEQRHTVHKDTTIITSRRAYTSANVFVAGLCRMTGGNTIKQVRPMLRWELDLVCDTLTLERDRVALRLS